ncbi:MAG TPA: DedA family protein [Anaerolineaceae bacterium]
MNFMDVINFLLNIDQFLEQIISQYGTITYILLFLVIFVETGLVVTPFLPGDSLLFAAGALAATTGKLDPYLLFLLMAIAAVLGDTVNYWIGHFIGPKVFSIRSRFIKQEYLLKTQRFYDKHGGKTIFLARFVPIVRTFAPFVAGVGKMRYGYFISYNIFGGIIWTGVFIFLGYFFGNIPFVQKNFELIIIAIVLISVLPAVFEFVKEKYFSKPAVEPQSD